MQYSIEDKTKNKNINKYLLFLLIFAIVSLFIFFLKKKQSNFKVYKNERLGITFLYPKEYVKLTDILYPLPLVIFANGSDCKKLNFLNFKKIGNCSQLSIWQQPEPYSFNLESTKLLSDKKIQLKKGSANIKTYRNLGLEINTIQIPRYDVQDKQTILGELIIEYFYPEEKSTEGKKVLDKFLKSLEVTQFYTKISPPPCCKEISPIILVENLNRLWIFQQNKLERIPFNLENNLAINDEQLSPDGSKIAFSYINKKDIDLKEAMYKSPKTGIGLIEAKPPFEYKSLVDAGINSYTKLSWSPDGRYLAYVLNDGENIGIIDTIANKTMFLATSSADPLNLDSLFGGPLVWLNKEEFSFLYQGKLYVGNLNNPLDKLIGDNAISADYGFESPLILHKPFWSLDRNYVMYRTKDSAIIKDVKTGKIYSFGKLITSPVDITYLNIKEIGWTKNNEFLFAEDFKPKRAKIESNKLVIKDIFDFVTDHTGGKSFSLTPDGRYLISYADYNPHVSLTIYDLEKNKKICPNIKASIFYNSFIANNKVYIIVNPLITEWAQAQNNWMRAIDQVRSILEIINIDSCSSVGGFMIDMHENPASSIRVSVISK